MAANVSSQKSNGLGRKADIEKMTVLPSLEDVHQIVEAGKKLSNAPNLIPLCASISSEFLTPSAIYLKIAAEYCSLYSTLL